jgi:recombination protein RecA
MASLPAVSESPFALRDGHSAHSALLAYLSETPRLARVTPATRLEIRPAPPVVSFGIGPLDRCTGGLPRGCLTEISGPDSSGRTSVLLAALAAATRRGEICALIDAGDAFHPHSGAAAGIDLSRLLWVRCTQSQALDRTQYFELESEQNRSAKSISLPSQGKVPRRPTTGSRRHPYTSLQEDWQRRQIENPVEQALRATDLLLQSGGFGMIAIDLAGVPAKIARRIPLTTWFRFRRTIEATPTILLAVDAHPCAQTCATLSLRMGQQEEVEQDRSSIKDRPADVDGWPLGKKPSAFRAPHLTGSSRLSVVSSQLPDSGFQPSPEALPLLPSHAHLLAGLPIRVELLHSRLESRPVQSATVFFSHSTASSGRDAACPVSARSTTQRIAPQTVNVFHLRSHQLRAHG